jgi:glucosamine--fructose-6-phosphate aminotransferase (isomerizing)
MCGIFGYCGKQDNAGAIVIKGLKNLEYRGYDSWGVAMRKADGTLRTNKDIGKIGSVKPEEYNDESHLAVAHSRWATHGGVTKENAHPHFSCDQRISVVPTVLLKTTSNFVMNSKQKVTRFCRRQTQKSFHTSSKNC